jgi:DNA polymerase III subunit beta
MKFSIKRDILLKSLSFVQGVVEKKNTLPILSNVLLEVKNSKLTILATDLDILFSDEISNLKVVEEGSTTTSANVLYDILRKISSNSEINFDLKNENKLSLNVENSDFNLLCLPTDNFPTFSDDFNNEEVEVPSKNFLALLNKSKISISNDDTRHYLNGIFLHITKSETKNFLTGVSTDSHRLSSSSIDINNAENFNSLIIPRKTVYLLISLLESFNEKILIKVSESKIQFKIDSIILSSKIIDGKFPDYKKVVPLENNIILEVPTKEFINSIERVISVSLDKKEGVKLAITQNKIKLSVNSTNSGEGNEIISAKYSGNDLTISFNSRYLIDIASEIKDKDLKINLKDPVSPVLIEDKSDKNSYYVIMPMKI